MSFLSLPIELRHMIYEYLLIDNNPINPPHKNPWNHFSINILFTNKTIHGEASAVFYSRNIFDIKFLHSVIRPWFLQIGRQNADNIRHIKIFFPTADIEDGARYGEDTALIFDILTRGLPNLRKLEMEASEFPKITPNGYRNTPEILSRMHDRLKAIPSLQEIIVQIHGVPFSKSVKMQSFPTQMESYGWKLEMYPPWLG